MERTVLAYVDFDGVPHLTGRLWARARGGRESASFEYDKSWLENPLRFSLEPALQLGPGPYHTADDGAIGDSAPDRWGRALMRRMERRRADREKQTSRTLFELDYLLLVDDQTRAGALRFKTEEAGPQRIACRHWSRSPNYWRRQSMSSTRTKRTKTCGC